MRMFFNFQSFYFKQMYKSILYIGANIFMLVMLFIRFIINGNSDYEYMNYGNFVGEISLIVQALLLLLMVWFYKFFSDEYKFGASQLFIGTFKITLLKILALLVNHLFIMVFFTTLQVTMVFIYFNISGIPLSQFYTDTIIYILYYWFSPSILAFFIGIFLALFLGKKHITYILMIFIWICIGPLNTSLFSNYFREMSPKDWGNLLLLSPLNNSDVYRDIVGYNFNSSVLCANGFWVFFISALIVICLLKSTRTIIDKRAILFTTSVLFVISASLIPRALEERPPVFDYKKIVEEARFSEEKLPSIDTKYLLYEIQEYEILLDVEDDVLATVKLQLDLLNDDTSTIAFSLFHQLNIQSVTTIQGDKLSFSQIGDFVFVEKPTDSLIFTYKIEDSALLPVSKEYLFLPSYINWLPKRESKSQLIYDEAIERESILIMNAEPADYTLTINEEMEGSTVYTNLTKQKNNVYSGISIKGITLIAGAINKERIDDKLIVYPQSWSDILAEWPAYEKALTDTHNYVVNMFKIKGTQIPNDIIFLTTGLKYDSYLYDDHLIIHHSTLYTPSWAVHEIPEMYIPALLWNKSSHVEMIDTGLKEAFNELLVNFLFKEIKYDTPVKYISSFNLTPLDPMIRYQDTVTMGINDFYEDFSHLEQSEQKVFLIKWYENFSDYNSWDKSIRFMESFKKEIGK